MAKPKNTKQISKKLRFEVFKRDGFKCAYCGKSPPAVVLEVDHIDPRSLGGSNDINNLITACFDCNRGKKAIPLSKIPRKLSENLEVLKEQEAQLKEYQKYAKKINLRTKKDMDEIDTIYQDAYPDWSFSEPFRNTSLKKFLSLLPKEEIIASLYLSISRFPYDKDRVIRYFCGVCWHKIKKRVPKC